MMGDTNQEITKLKFEEYSAPKNPNNYTTENEITVTITLNEYRDLVQKAATSNSAIEAANADRYDRNKKIEDLSKEVERLNADNNNLKTQLYEFQRKELGKENSPVFVQED